MERTKLWLADHREGVIRVVVALAGVLLGDTAGGGQAVGALAALLSALFGSS